MGHRYRIKQINKRRWKVLGGERPYMVVREHGKYFCSCTGGNYRGLCKHVMMVRMDIDHDELYPVTIPDPTELKQKRVFEKFLVMPRFVAEPWIDGQRFLVSVGVETWANSIGVNYLNTGEINFGKYFGPHLAGSIIDVVVTQKQTDGCRADHDHRKYKCVAPRWVVDKVFIIDVPVWKGTSLCAFPLIERRKWIMKVEEESEDVVAIPWRYKTAAKLFMRRWTNDRIILKDQSAPYKCGRNWFFYRKEG